MNMHFMSEPEKCYNVQKWAFTCTPHTHNFVCFTEGCLAPLSADSAGGKGEERRESQCSHAIRAKGVSKVCETPGFHKGRSIPAFKLADSNSFTEGIKRIGVTLVQVS